MREVLVISLVLCFLSVSVYSAKPADEIFLANFNQSFYLANETYWFQLVPSYKVPNQLRRHVIYTASTSAVQSSTKRAILESREPIELSEEDHSHLHDLMDGDIPTVVRVNNKKRSLPPIGNGLRAIRLTNKAVILSTTPPDLTRKRFVQQTYGTTFCLHIPFFTTCDNSADLDTVKTALQASVDEIHSELDSYEKTNNARINALTQALNSQRSIIDSMFESVATTNDLVAQVANSVQVNAAQIMDGDYQAQSQIDYLKRVTNSLLKFSNALASTDPRAVVAQPSLSKLFDGYIQALEYLSSNKSDDGSYKTPFTPIVDYSLPFTWQETILPAQSVQNSSKCACLDSGCSISTGIAETTVYVFSAVLSLSCVKGGPSDYPSVPSCVSPSTVVIESTRNWLYGPFHKNHYGIYNVTVDMSPSTQISSFIMQPIVQAVNTGTITTAAFSRTPGSGNCVQFLGYTMFLSISDTPDLVNGVNVGAALSTDCDVYRLVEGAVTTSQIYSLYTEAEGVVIPFYSNCDIPDIQDGLLALLGGSVPSTVAAMNYVCSNAWMDGVDSNCNPSPDLFEKSAKSISNVDIYLYHWITPTCYINIEPGWLNLDYYVNPPLVNIPGIPRGYNLNQFTINNEGELASSLEFVYTDRWVQTYIIHRVSNNHLITDEVNQLEGSPVLFHLDATSVVDESDSFFGMGNNGRDCIQQADSYDYNLLNCFFQNDNLAYTANQYLSGNVKTSGIARYNDKYDFSLNIDSITQVITFSLVCMPDADFSYSVEMDGSVCPRLVNQESKTDGCSITLFYLGSETVSLSGANTGNVVGSVSFVNKTAEFPIDLDTWTVSVGGRECFLLDCHYTQSFSVVQLVTPNVQLISASDKALETEVSFSISETIKSTIDSMNNVIEQVNEANQNISVLRAQLDELNFNVSSLYPYQDFTEMRQQVDSLIAAIPSGSSDEDDGCDGPWNSAVCWFQDFASTLIIIAIIVGVILIGYLGCYRTGFYKKLCPAKTKTTGKQEMQTLD